jgi:hypothetical protein
MSSYHFLNENRLHTIPLLSLTLQLSAHQEWEGNKPGMALHPDIYAWSHTLGLRGCGIGPWV